MRTFARLTAWSAIALTAVAVVAAELTPTVNAGLAGAVSLCTPAEVSAPPGSGSQEPCPPHAATLRVPRCGVA
jgi:hypothetical protein